jgi:hypothetical protein
MALGDIHQPLHVGGVYFDKTCKVQVDPNVAGAGQANFGIGRTIAETVGGNKIAMPDGDLLHHYWDDETVESVVRLAKLKNTSARSLAHCRLLTQRSCLGRGHAQSDKAHAFFGYGEAIKQLLCNATRTVS